MSEKRCEGCGAQAAGAYGLLDYCAVCGADLCDTCMAKGHCGHVPAISGSEDDDGDAEQGDAA